MMNKEIIKQFLKPDWKKILIFLFIFLVQFIYMCKWAGAINFLPLLWPFNPLFGISFSVPPFTKIPLLLYVITLIYWYFSILSNNFYL